MPVRIVAGKHKGVRLDAPEGPATRPTSDRARENLFNILGHGDYAEKLRGGRVLELFAGTGALGLEALSRGGAHCVFVENSKPALAALRANIAKCRAEDRSKVEASDAFRLRPQAKPYDLVLIDPPYRERAIEQAIKAALDARAVGADTLVIAQLDPKTTWDTPEGFTLLDDRRYGAARFLFFTRSQ